MRSISQDTEMEGSFMLSRVQRLNKASAPCTVDPKTSLTSCLKVIQSNLRCSWSILHVDFHGWWFNDFCIASNMWSAKSVASSTSWEERKRSPWVMRSKIPQARMECRRRRTQHASQTTAWTLSTPSSSGEWNCTSGISQISAIHGLGSSRACGKK